MRKHVLILLTFSILPFLGWAQDQMGGSEESPLVEVSGVVLTEDSLRNIPGVSVYIKSKNRGTVANDEGVFSLVAEKGDTITFSVVGFKKAFLAIPEDLGRSHLAVAQKLSQDTTYLPLAVIHSYPTKEEFEYAFLHWDIPMTQYDIARANTSEERLRSLSPFIMPDGGEGVSHTFRSRETRMRSKGQMPAMNIFNPLAWGEFIKALKDGDFKRK